MSAAIGLSALPSKADIGQHEWSAEFKVFMQIDLDDQSRNKFAALDRLPVTVPIFVSVFIVYRPHVVAQLSRGH
jgi:hypothetical protein